MKSAPGCGSALPVSLVDATDVLFLNADILILGLFVEAELVAFYFAATRLAQMLGYVPYGVSAVSAQRFAALGASRDTDRLQSMIQTAALGSTVLSMGGAVFLTAAASLLLSLFGPGFEAAAPVVPILCAGVVLTCLLGPGKTC
jgi:O-antigen/teichoic acid export membrane protein